MMYCSFFGRVDWQNAFWKSPDFGVRCILTADAINDLNSSCDITGAKQSCLVQACGSKLPNTTILYLALIGLPSASFLIIEIAILGRAFPVSGRSIWYSFSEIYSQVLVSSVSPKNSLRYARS